MNQSLLGKFVRFVKKPEYIENIPEKKWYLKVFDILRLWSFQYLIYIFVGILLLVLTSIFSYDFENHSVNQLFQNYSLPFVIFLVVVFAPITEEITFRLGLKFSHINLSLTLSSLIILVVNVLQPTLLKNIIPDWFLSLTSLGGLASYLILLIFGSLIIYFILKKFLPYNSSINFYKKRARLLFYLSVIVFGFVHLINYNNLNSLVLLSPFLVLPQVIAGVFLGFVRLNYGFIWGVINHALHNGFSIIPVVILSLGSENLRKIQNSAEPVSLSNTDYMIISILLFGFIISLLLFISFTLHLIIEWYLKRK